jgi:hypothetical protein
MADTGAAFAFGSLPPDLLRLVLSHVVAPAQEWPELACTPMVPHFPEQFDGLFRLSHGPVNRQLHMRRWRVVSVVSKQWRQLALGFVHSAMVRVRLPGVEQEFLSGAWVQGFLGQLSLLHNLQCLTLCLSLDDLATAPSDPSMLSDGPEFWFCSTHQHTRRYAYCWSQYADLWRSPMKHLSRDGEDCSSALSPALIAGLHTSAEATSGSVLPLVQCVRQVASKLRRLTSLELLWSDTKTVDQLSPIGTAGIQALLRGFGVAGTLRALRLDLVGLQPLLAAPQVTPLYSRAG